MVKTDIATAASGSDSPDIITVLKTLMIEQSLPLWSSEGWDRTSGGFVDRLGPDGRADHAAPRRVFVQARQIYCFAKAAQIGWFPQGREIALKGLEHLLAKAKSPDGRPGFVHTLAPDGSVLDPLRDSYDHAFVLLALANVYALDRDAQVRTEIEALLLFLDTQLRSPNGGFLEGVPWSMPRRQNPQMHLFEAMIAAFDATHDMVFQQRAGELFGLFSANLYDRQKRVVGEYFEDDWSRIEPVVVEPGHQAEWVWLLKGFERITGCPTSRPRGELLETALKYRDAAGCVVDEGRRRRQHQTAQPAPMAANRNGQGVDRAGRSRRSRRCGRGARRIVTPRTALPAASRCRRLVRSVRRRRPIDGCHHPGVVVLSRAMRVRGKPSRCWGSSANLAPLAGRGRITSLDVIRVRGYRSIN